MCGRLFYMQFTEKSYRNTEAVGFANTICSCHGNSILLPTRSMEKIVKHGVKNM